MAVAPDSVLYAFSQLNVGNALGRSHHAFHIGAARVEAVYPAGHLAGQTLTLGYSRTPTVGGGYSTDFIGLFVVEDGVDPAGTYMAAGLGALAAGVVAGFVWDVSVLVPGPSVVTIGSGAAHGATVAVNPTTAIQRGGTYRLVTTFGNAAAECARRADVNTAGTSPEYHHDSDAAANSASGGLNTITGQERSSGPIVRLVDVDRLAVVNPADGQAQGDTPRIEADLSPAGIGTGLVNPRQVRLAVTDTTEADPTRRVTRDTTPSTAGAVVSATYPVDNTTFPASSDDYTVQLGVEDVLGNADTPAGQMSATWALAGASVSAHPANRRAWTELATAAVGLTHTGARRVHGDDTVTVDPRLTITHHLQVSPPNGPVWGTPPGSLLESSYRMLNDRIGRAAARLVNARGEGRNGITYTERVEDDSGEGQVYERPSADTTVTQGGQAGWSNSFLLWDPTKPGGFWTHTVTPTGVWAGLGAPLTQRLTLLSRNPDLVCIPGGGPASAADDATHLAPGIPALVGVVLLSRSLGTAVEPDTAEDGQPAAYCYIGAFNVATGRREFLALDGVTWVPQEDGLGGQTPGATHRLARSSTLAPGTDDLTFVKMFSGAQTAMWGHRDLYIAAWVEVLGTPYPLVRRVEAVGPHHRHDTAPTVGPHAHSLDSLTDVDAAAPLDGELLGWVEAAAAWQPTAGGAGPHDHPHDHDGDYAPLAHGHALDDLTDVTITNPQAGETVEWDGTSWVNAEAASVGELLVFGLAADADTPTVAAAASTVEIEAAATSDETDADTTTPEARGET